MGWAAATALFSTGVPTAGASLGNAIAICLFNIIAAASMAGLEDHRAVLAYSLVPKLLTVLLVDALGWTWLLGWR